MGQKTKEEMDYILANNDLIAKFMGIGPEIEYMVGDDEGSIYHPRNVYSWATSQWKECERWLSEHPELVKQGYKTIKREWWPLYNQDWNKLMEVWIRFRDLKFEETRDQFMHSDMKTILSHSICYEDITNAYNKMVKAINWYNTTK